MNEISRCCRVLNVKPGASVEEVKQAYHDLVQIWHPDRFSENERLRNATQERLSEINVAYEYLKNNAIQNGFLVDPASASTTETATEFTPSSSPAASSQTSQSPGEEERKESHTAQKNFWGLVSIASVIVGCGVLLYLKVHPAQKAVPALANASNGVPHSNPPFSQPGTPIAKLGVPTAFPSSFASSTDVLAGMAFTNEDGWLQSTNLLSPPFAMRLNVELTNLADVRLSYALGLVIFNWSDRPKELRVHDPRNSSITPTAEEGLLLPGQPQELYWEITTNEMTVIVNGQTRFRAKGNYTVIKGFAGIKPHDGPVSVKAFVLETPRSLDTTSPVPRNHVVVADDMLSSMVPEKNVRVSNDNGAIGVTSGSDSSNRLMSAEKLQPPFIIHTRAKTDARDLRLYWGAGMVIFNWEPNPQELRVHDPLNGQQFGFPGKGLISPNEWHEITWDIEKTGMRLLVDGQLRFQNKKYYSLLAAPVGIGGYNSKVTVDYFSVEKEK